MLRGYALCGQMFDLAPFKLGQRALSRILASDGQKEKRARTKDAPLKNKIKHSCHFLCSPSCTLSSAQDFDLLHRKSVICE